MLGSDGHHNQSHRHLHILNMIRSVERALNERRRALKLLQKETKRHSGAKVIVKKFPCLQRTCQKCVLHPNIAQDEDADKLNTAKADFDKKSQTLRLEKQI